MQTLDFYFDFLSPFSYLGHKSLLNLKGKLDLEVCYYPVPMGSLFEKNQTKGPAQIDSKRKFLLKQILRKCQREKIPFNGPSSLPFNPLLLLRLVIAVENTDREKIVTEIYDALWAEGDFAFCPDDPDYLANWLKQKGFAGEQVVNCAFEREVKKKLKYNIQKAVKQGVFGVPSFIINDELFWGEDSLKEVEKFIEGNDEYDYEVFKQIENRTQMN